MSDNNRNATSPRPAALPLAKVGLCLPMNPALSPRAARDTAARSSPCSTPKTSPAPKPLSSTAPLQIYDHQRRTDVGRAGAAVLEFRDTWITPE